MRNSDIEDMSCLVGQDLGMSDSRQPVDGRMLGQFNHKIDSRYMKTYAVGEGGFECLRICSGVQIAEDEGARYPFQKRVLSLRESTVSSDRLHGVLWEENKYLE